MPCSPKAGWPPAGCTYSRTLTESLSSPTSILASLQGLSSIVLSSAGLPPSADAPGAGSHGSSAAGKGDCFSPEFPPETHDAVGGAGSPCGVLLAILASSGASALPSKNSAFASKFGTSNLKGSRPFLLPREGRLPMAQGFQSTHLDHLGLGVTSPPVLPPAPPLSLIVWTRALTASEHVRPLRSFSLLNTEAKDIVGPSTALSLPARRFKNWRRVLVLASILLSFSSADKVLKQPSRISAKQLRRPVSPWSAFVCDI
mmetsp:Transcript_1405/g.3103  ORF Transcript_1405/g.3103 Transcript_1405/m.3103 type:complete len:258 (+) Transcript_1405:72-845(+)